MVRKRWAIFLFIFIIFTINPFLVNYIVASFNFSQLYSQIFLNFITTVIILAAIYFKDKKDQNIILDKLAIILAGDYRQSLELKENNFYYPVKKSINKLLANIRQIFARTIEETAYTEQGAEDLQKEVDSISEMSKNISKAINEVAAGAENQAEKLDNIEGSFKNINNYMKETHQKTAEVADSSQKASTIAEKGNNMVAELSSESRKNNKTIEKTMTEIQNLTEKFIKVNEIVDIISKIAAETNLLALNASIEAARAGSNGDSFEVVANRVRGLAEEVDHSAKNISDLLEKVNGQVDSVYQQMDKNVSVIKNQSNKTEELGKILDRLNKIVSENYHKMENLNQETGSINQNIDSVDQDLADLLAIAQENTANSEEVTSSIKKQNQLYQKINEMSEKLHQDAADSEKRLGSKILDKTMLNLCYLLREKEKAGGITTEKLKELKREHHVDIASVTNRKGEFVYSTSDDILGINIYEINEWIKNLDLNNPEDSLITPIHRRVEDNQLFKFASIPRVEGNGMLQIGMSLDSLVNISAGEKS